MLMRRHEAATVVIRTTHHPKGCLRCKKPHSATEILCHRTACEVSRSGWIKLDSANTLPACRWLVLSDSNVNLPWIYWNIGIFISSSGFSMTKENVCYKCTVSPGSILRNLLYPRKPMCTWPVCIEKHKLIIGILSKGHLLGREGMLEGLCNRLINHGTLHNFES